MAHGGSIELVFLDEPGPWRRLAAHIGFLAAVVDAKNTMAAPAGHIDPHRGGREREGHLGGSGRTY